MITLTYARLAKEQARSANGPPTSSASDMAPAPDTTLPFGKIKYGCLLAKEVRYLYLFVGLN